MKRIHYLLLGILGSGMAAVMLWIQPVAAVMDSDYYYALGQQIFWGHGGEQPFIWNYLADPKGVPMPSFDYWMPLPAVLAAIGMRLAGTTALWAARLPFVILHGINVALIAYLVFRRTGRAFIAGWVDWRHLFHFSMPGLSLSPNPSRRSPRWVLCISSLYSRQNICGVRKGNSCVRWSLGLFVV